MLDRLPVQNGTASPKPSFLKNRTLRGFLHVLGGTATTTALQGLQFLLLARGLGPAEFGRIATANSVTALLMPFSGLGFANVMIMRSTRDPRVLPLYLGNALGMAVCSGALLVALSGVAAGAWLQDELPVTLMLVIAVGELLAAKVIDICWHVFIAREQLHFTSRVMGFHSAARLTFAAGYVWLNATPTAVGWAWWLLACNTLVSALILHFTLGIVGRLRADFAVARSELGMGSSFAVGISAKGFYTDADKMFLARFAGAEAVGHYTVAFRVIQIALAPIRALSFALQARLFRAGEQGIRSSLRVTIKILVPLSIAALVLAVGFYVTAPLLTIFAGDKYAGSVDVLRTLCLLPLLLAAQSLMADTLASSGHQRSAAIAEVLAAILVCVLCMTLIPELGWRGAAIASYASQATLVLTTVATVVRLTRRKSHA
ncbi:MAG TPA: oligosaccharide flippase family protein [Polyangiales bacterium]|nr:oligosaccharide flippase family protein [Polyangiales bacterium]